MPRPYRTTLTPEQLSERARKGAQARHSLDTYVKTVVDRAPELTPAQRDLLAGIFAGHEAA
jgi:hypothetical protein